MLAAFAIACAPPEDDSVAPTPTRAAVTPGHTEPLDFNQVVLTGAARAAAAGFSGTYTLRARTAEQVIDGKVTWHRSGPRARADFEGTMSGQETEMIVIAGADYPADDLLYVCRTADESCAEARRTVGGEYPVDILPAVLALRLLDTSVFASGLTFSDEAARTLVDEDVLCFVGEAPVSGSGIDHGEVCLTEVGVPLLVTASGTGTTVTFAATDAPGAFDDGAFDLPYALE
jgi:hypothetical protein